MTEMLFWNWWVLAIILLAIELLAPGFFFLWMSAAGLVTGCLLWLAPTISSELQILIFSVLSILAITLWRIYGKKYQIESDSPLLNKRGAQYVGRVFILLKPIENGTGKITVGDSVWAVRGEDCDAGAKVKVVSIHGTVFDVEIAE